MNNCFKFKVPTVALVVESAGLTSYHISYAILILLKIALGTAFKRKLMRFIVNLHFASSLWDFQLLTINTSNKSYSIIRDNHAYEYLNQRWPDLLQLKVGQFHIGYILYVCAEKSLNLFYIIYKSTNISFYVRTVL